MSNEAQQPKPASEQKEGVVNDLRADVIQPSGHVKVHAEILMTPGAAKDFFQQLITEIDNAGNRVQLASPGDLGKVKHHTLAPPGQ